MDKNIRWVTDENEAPSEVAGPLPAWETQTCDRHRDADPVFIHDCSGAMWLLTSRPRSYVKGDCGYCHVEDRSSEGVSKHGMLLRDSEFRAIHHPDFSTLMGYVARVKFIDSRLPDSWFSYSTLSSVEFHRCNLRRSRWVGTKFRGVRFVDCDLQRSYFGYFRMNDVWNLEFVRCRFLERPDVENATFTDCYIDEEQ